MQRLTGLFRGRLSGERGATAVVFALLLVPILGFAAIAVDVGSLYAERARLQVAADAAASRAPATLAPGLTSSASSGRRNDRASAGGPLPSRPMKTARGATSAPSKRSRRCAMSCAADDAEVAREKRTAERA